MSSLNKKSKKIIFEPEEKLKLSIGSLLGLGDEPQAEEKIADEPDRINKNPPTIPKLQKISFHKQRAGRGGKTVTTVTISGDIKTDLDLLLKELKKGLGCGGQIEVRRRTGGDVSCHDEERQIVLHGDISDRAAQWFDKMRKSK